MQYSASFLSLRCNAKPFKFLQVSNEKTQVFFRQLGWHTTSCRLAMWQKSTPELSDYYKCVRHKTNFKLSLNLPYCQTAVM